STIVVNGSAATFTRTSHELTITPAEFLPQGKSFEIAVSYSGIPGEGVPGYDAIFAQGWTRYKKGVFVASEPNGAALWYPVNDHPLDKASYTFHITVPAGYVVAANGLLQGVDKHDDSTQTYNWETTSELASYLVTVDIGDFVVETAEGPNNLPIRSYFP